MSEQRDTQLTIGYTNKSIVYVRYKDHVLYNRASAIAMQPQVREAVGWLVYECDQYVTISWDRDAQPPTLHGKDPKASGLVLLRSDIIVLERLKVEAKVSHENSERVLNASQPIAKDEYALQPKKRKTHGAKDSIRKERL